MRAILRGMQNAGKHFNQKNHCCFAYQHFTSSRLSLKNLILSEVPNPFFLILQLSAALFQLSASVSVKSCMKHGIVLFLQHLFKLTGPSMHGSQIIVHDCLHMHNIISPNHIYSRLGSSWKLIDCLTRQNLVVSSIHLSLTLRVRLNGGISHPFVTRATCTAKWRPFVIRATHTAKWRNQSYASHMTLGSYFTIIMLHYQNGTP